MHLTFLIELYVCSPLFFVFLEAITFSKRKSKLFSGKIHSAYLSFLHAGNGRISKVFAWLDEET